MEPNPSGNHTAEIKDYRLALQSALRNKRYDVNALDIVEQVKNGFSNHADLAILSGRILEQSGALSAAASAYRRVLRSDAVNETALLALLRICLRRSRFDLIRLLLLGPLRSSQPHQTHLARARLALFDRDAKLAQTCLIAAKAAGASDQRLHKLFVSVRRLAAHQAHPIEHAFRHITIGGTVFCGSTLLSLLLGSADAVFNIGESHHLVDRIEPKQVGCDPRVALSGGEFAWETDEPRLFFPCQTCGPQCDVFDNSFRHRLASNRLGWYARVAERAGTRTLVSSDKNSHFLLTHDPESDFDLIIIYKSPAAAWQSELKNKTRLARLRIDRPALHRDVQTYLDRCVGNYLALLRVLRPKGRTVAMSWERFCAAPEAHLERLWRLLDLPAPAHPFNQVRTDQHFFGGNVDVRSDSLLGVGQVIINPPPPVHLPRPDAARVAAHTEAHYVFGLLEFRYRQAFGAVADKKRPDVPLAS